MEYKNVVLSGEGDVNIDMRRIIGVTVPWGKTSIVHSTIHTSIS